ncbi:hypothetical protein EC991_003485 [Linnemannia zychae]|nr:hypothetical protein EC991_003485 [Linnemannia zychae]
MRIQLVFGQAKAVGQASTNIGFPLFSLLLAALFFPTASAQVSVEPTPVYQVEFTSFNDKTLYIRGGLNKGTVVKQFYALDISPLLTYSNKLTWKKLNEVGLITDFQSEMPMAVDRENQSIYNFGKSRMMTEYNLALERWMTGLMPICFIPNLPPDTVKGTQKAVMDPNTNLIYIPFGYMTTEMLVFEPAERRCSSLPMPPASTVNTYAWSESKNTIYMFGDTVPPGGPTMWELQFATKTWKQLPTQGALPPLLNNNCMTSAFGGQKLIVFGGTNNVEVASGEVHIFDTATYTWTKGAVSPSARSDIACASSGDFFIAWGGKDASQGNNSPAEILFYNMKTNKWVKQSDIGLSSNSTDTANPPVSTGPESGNITGSPNTDSAAFKVNGAVIGGGVAGAIVLFALIGFLFYRRGKKAGASKHSQEKKPNSFSNAPAASSATLDHQSLQMDNIPNSSTVGMATPVTTPYNPAYSPYLEPSAPPLASPAPSYTSAVSSPYISAASPYAEPHGMAGSRYINENSGYVPSSHSRPIPTETPYGVYPKSSSNTMSEKTHMPSAPQLDDVEHSHRLGSGPSSNSSQYIPPPSSHLQQHQQVDIPSSSSDILDTPLERVVETGGKIDNSIEQIRQEQQAELERTRKRWAENKTGGLVSAQAVVQPAPVARFEFTSYNNKTLYIRGGLNQGFVSKQFYALDISPLLTYSNKLTWKKLNEVGPIIDFRSVLPMAVDRENQVVYNFAEGKQMAIYNVTLGKWITSAVPICLSPKNPRDSVRGTRRAMVDHKTDLIYIPEGYAGTEILVFEPAGRKCSSLPMPPASEVNNYAWSESKSTIYMFGDTVPAKGPTMWELQFATKTWKKLTTLGTPPPLLRINCMTSAFGGQKLIVFGGTDDIKTVSGEVHIFDTATYTWTKGAVSLNARSNPGCASSGDFIVIWGGHDATDGRFSPAEILFYNMKTNQWVKQNDIAPPANTTTTTPLRTDSGSNPPTPTGPGNIIGTPSADSVAFGMNGAAVGGGVTGAIVLFALVGLLFYRRGKKAGASKHSEERDLNSFSHTPEASSSATLDRQSVQMDIIPNPSTIYMASATTAPYNPAYSPYLEPSAPPLASPAPSYASATNSPHISAASPYAESHGMAGSSYFDSSSGYFSPPLPRPLPTETPFGAYPKSSSSTMFEKTHIPSAPHLNDVEYPHRLDSGPTSEPSQYYPPPSPLYAQQHQQAGIPPADDDSCDSQDQDQSQCLELDPDDVLATYLEQVEETEDNNEHSIEQIQQDQRVESEQAQEGRIEDSVRGMQK